MSADKIQNSLFKNNIDPAASSKLYSFLSTSYDLTAVANRLRSVQGAKKNIISLKLNGNNSI